MPAGHERLSAVPLSARGLLPSILCQTQTQTVCIERRMPRQNEAARCSPCAMRLMTCTVVLPSVPRVPPYTLYHVSHVVLSALWLPWCN